MQCMRSRKLTLSVVSAFVFGGILLMASDAFGSPEGEPDVPSAKPSQHPRSIEQEVKLADDYLLGRGVAQDLKMSAYWYQKAAEAGDPVAQLQTCLLYTSPSPRDA